MTHDTRPAGAAAHARTAAAVVGALAMSGCVAQRASWVAFDERPRVDAAIDAWHHAAAHGDFGAYFALMTDDAVFLGTDPSERWDRAAFESFARPFFDGVEAWTYRPRDRHLAFTPDGRTGWFDEVLDHDRYGVLRGTGVVRAGHDGHWRIAHYSLTFLVPNDDAPAVVERIRRGPDRDSE